MRPNLPAETIQIGVTEVPGQVRQTHFQSGTIESSIFHNMRFDHQPLLGKMMTEWRRNM